MCLATPSAYSVVNLDTGAQTPIGLPISQSTTVSSARIRPSIVPVPVLADEPQPTFLITSHSDAGTLGAFIRTDGEPTARIIEWPSHPRSVVADFPYVCALLRNDTIEMHDMRTLQHVQTLQVDPATEPRFLLRIAKNTHLVSSKPCVWARSVQVTWKSGASPEHARWRPDGTALLPSERDVSTAPVRVVFGCKRSLACLARHTPSSVALLEAHRGRWTAAERILQADASPEAAEHRAMAQLVGLNHLFHVRFLPAAAWFVRGRLDPRMLLAKFPAYSSYLPVDLPAGTLAEAALPTWHALAPIDALITANLEMNYVPELDADDVVLVSLRTMLERRADDMLCTVLLEYTAHATDEAMLRVAHTVLLEIALARNPCVVAADVETHAAACDEAVARDILVRHQRHALYAQVLAAHGRATQALELRCRLVDGELKDPIDTVHLSDVASEINALTSPADMAAWALWLARHNLSMGLDVRDFSCSDTDAFACAIRWHRYTRNTACAACY